MHHDQIVLNSDHKIITGLTVDEKNLVANRVHDNDNDINNDDSATYINPQHLILFLTIIYQGISEAFAYVHLDVQNLQ